MKFTGIVLSGGKSSRMGADKGLLKYNGKMMVEYPLELLAKFCDKILISVNSENYNAFGYEIIADEIANAGPAGGIAATLKTSKTDWNIVIGCDMPNLNDVLIQKLIAEVGALDGIVPIHDGMIEPLVAIYHRSIYTHIEKHLKEGRNAIYLILKDLKIKYVDISPLLEEFPNLLSNVNSPKDLGFFE